MSAHPAETRAKVKAALDEFEVPKKDRYDVVNLAAAFFMLSAGGGRRPAHEVLRTAAGISGTPRTRAQNLAAKYEKVLAALLGRAEVGYRASMRHTTGRGAFGRLGGTELRSNYHAAGVHISPQTKGEALVTKADLISPPEETDESVEFATEEPSMSKLESLFETVRTRELAKLAEAANPNADWAMLWDAQSALLRSPSFGNLDALFERSRPLGMELYSNTKTDGDGVGLFLAFSRDGNKLRMWIEDDGKGRCVLLVSKDLTGQSTKVTKTSFTVSDPSAALKAIDAVVEELKDLELARYLVNAAKAALIGLESGLRSYDASKIKRALNQYGDKITPKEAQLLQLVLDMRR